MLREPYVVRVIVYDPVSDKNIIYNANVDLAMGAGTPPLSQDQMIETVGDMIKTGFTRALREAIDKEKTHG